MHCRKGLDWVFSNKFFTAWGGLRVIEEVIRRIKLKEVLEACGMPQPRSNRGYDPVDILESFLVTVWTGGCRFSHTAMVRYDEALKRIFGWKQVPCVSSFTRFFGRFGRIEVDNVFGYINRWFWKKVNPITITLDLDSTVVTRFGEQEGSCLGYNPKKPGRPSHHPLMAFVADIRMVLHAWLRCANTASSSNVNNFFEEAIELLGPEHRIGVVRADSGFFSDEFLSLLESRKYSYIVAAKLIPTIKNQICGLKSWVHVDRGLAVSEMKYQAHSWDHPRRLIIVRQTVADRPKAKGKMLFDIEAYRYQAYVTHMDLAPVEVWRLYRGRADSENRIKELKQDFGLNGFCMNSFYATEAAFRAVILAYNLMSLFRQLVLGGAVNQQLSTLRFQCFAIGSQLGKNGRNDLLRIGLAPKRRTWFEGLFSKIQDLHPPWPLKTNS